MNMLLLTYHPSWSFGGLLVSFYGCRHPSSAQKIEIRSKLLRGNESHSSPISELFVLLEQTIFTHGRASCHFTVKVWSWWPENSQPDSDNQVHRLKLQKTILQALKKVKIDVDHA